MGFQLVQGGADSELPRTESLLWGYVENKPLTPLLTIWTNSSGRQLCGGREKIVCVCALGGGGGGKGLKQREKGRKRNGNAKDC